MHDYIKERTIKIGRYIVETRNTVRTIAKEFGVSKSTVHTVLRIGVGCIGCSSMQHDR